MTKKETMITRSYIGYDMGSLETRCERQFGTSVFVWVQEYDKLKALLTNLQQREKAFDRRRAQAEASA